jgi:sugar (pentulose or hexulose) kinase
MHQADWLAFQLHGKLGVTDYHNALKSGGDPEQLDYPAWVAALPGANLLPRILEPGEKIGTITPRMAQYFTLPPDCVVRAGTTDSIAAFIAADARHPGEAVTSLGSTLALKLLSHVRVDHSPSGIYSHRFGDFWLVGGASNSGGAVLRSFFDDAQLASLSAKIEASHSSGLDYYPLNAPGERFPFNDPSYPPRLTPRPNSDVQFLHGLLEGIARIERDGYALIQSLGATPLQWLYSAGGGARNPAFMAIRAGLLGVSMKKAAHTKAAYGTALLARDGKRLLYSRHESA